jgi:hypothetical protein
MRRFIAEKIVLAAFLMLVVAMLLDPDFTILSINQLSERWEQKVGRPLRARMRQA